MHKLFMIRHQRAGILTQFAFTAEPTPEQMAPIVAEAERLHGKTGWIRLHELALLDPGEIPAADARPEGKSANGAAVELFVGSGTGQVG